MKAALRPALPLLLGIMLASLFALVGMHTLTFGTAAATLGSHHSVAVSGHASGDAELAVSAVLAAPDGENAHAAHGDAAHADAAHGDAASTHEQAAQAPANASHGHGASAACAAHNYTECCSSVVNASGAPTIAMHAFPGATVSAFPASVPAASLLATEAAERPPSRVLLSVIRV